MLWFHRCSLTNAVKCSCLSGTLINLVQEHALMKFLLLNLWSTFLHLSAAPGTSFKCIAWYFLKRHFRWQLRFCTPFETLISPYCFLTLKRCSILVVQGIWWLILVGENLAPWFCKGVAMLTVTSSNSVRSIKRTLSTVLLWSPLLNIDSEHLAKRGPTRAKMSRLALSWNGCSGFNKDGKAVQHYCRGFVVHKNFNRARNALLLQCYAKRYVGLLVVTSRIFNFKLETLTLLLLLTEIIYDKNPNCSENSWRRQERRAHENSAAHSPQIILLSDKILLADAVLMKKNWRNEDQEQ